MDNNVRLLEKSDVCRTNFLHVQTFGQFLEMADYISGSTYNYGIVLEIEQQIVGYLIGQIVYESAEIFYIAVEPTFQGNGYAQKLVKSFIEKVEALTGEAITLEVRTDNLAAIALYQNSGFVQIGRRKNYYGIGQDACMMQYKI